MNECLQTEKPLISILMAIYEPNLEWLKEQLDSLEKQTYPNLKLYIRDDCSQRVHFSKIEACVRACITRFPYTIQRNESNLGSNRTFERLTTEAQGEYFAYCDQDDIWLSQKLEFLLQEAERATALLVCSDMYIINEERKRIADSITCVRRHHIFYSGAGLAEKLLFHNFVTGCTMLVQAEAAKSAVPFCPHMVHDHYLALWCSVHGRIQSVREPLIQYRIHRNNQTSLLAGVKDKQSYGKIRIEAMLLRFRWLQKHFSCSPALQEKLKDGICWLEARLANWQHAGGKRIIWKYRRFSPFPSIFEIFAVWMPEPVFQLFIVGGKRNVI